MLVHHTYLSNVGCTTGVTPLLSCSLSIILGIILMFQTGGSTPEEIGRFAGLYAFIVLLVKELGSIVKWAIDRRSKFSVESLLKDILESINTVGKALNIAMQRQVTKDNISELVTPKKKKAASQS